MKRLFKQCNKALLLLKISLLLIGVFQTANGQTITTKGVRPYELDWAKRFQDDHTPLVDFENLQGWTIESNKGSAQFSRSEEQSIWGNYTGKIVYKGSPEGASFILRPPKPIRIEKSFTAVNLWAWNNYWKWFGDANNPRAILSLLLQTPTGQEFEIPFSRELDWPEWYLLHVRLSSEQRNAFANGGILKGFLLSHCLMGDVKSIYLDNLSFYTEENKPIVTAQEPRPGIDLAPGLSLGVHTGKDRLPFPTRNETLLPSNLTNQFSTEVKKEGAEYILRYKGNDGVLEYHYKPLQGNLGDITAQWLGSTQGVIRPLYKGGVKLATDNNVEGLLDRFSNYLPTEPKAVEPERSEMIDCKLSGQTIVSRWKLYHNKQTTEVEYTFRIWQKSLVVDVRSSGGLVGEVSLGSVEGAENPRLITVPYWTGQDNGKDKGRPAVLLMGSKPIFFTAYADYYQTGSSRFYFLNNIGGNTATCAGGTYYLPKTNAKRNDCYERIFITLSPRFEEVLPTISNPRSEWRDTVSQLLVLNHGAGNDRNKDYEHWKLAARYGLRKLVVMDHETGWRDGAESFTFRTVPAPGKGGDSGQLSYARRMQGLGVRYGIYNNYTDLVPVNAHWNEDLVARLPDGSWITAWYRCYAPKTQKTVSLEPIITSEIQQKFKLNAACLDVHTAITPWSRVDYDERIPGAGTMLSQFYDFGQLMLHQQKVWNGPTFSEGGNHYYYSGLITGSNAEDRGYDLMHDPWLVDFDLLKMHPLGCDVGFGFGKEKPVTEENWDRFFAGTIAFGHVGKLIDFKGEMNAVTLRSFYMLQQVQSSYAKANVKTIRYGDKEGKLIDVTSAVFNGAYKRSQIQVEYDNGLSVWVNGSNTENWKVPGAELPPNGYFAKNSTGDLIVFSGLINGNKSDFVHSPAYDYMDGRGKWLETPWGGSDGQLIMLKNVTNKTIEVIPFNTKDFWIALSETPASIVALDRLGNQLEFTSGLFEKGKFHISAIQGAFSYIIKLKDQPKNAKVN